MPKVCKYFVVNIEKMPNRLIVVNDPDYCIHTSRMQKKAYLISSLRRRAKSISNRPLICIPNTKVLLSFPQYQKFFGNYQKLLSSPLNVGGSNPLHPFLVVCYSGGYQKHKSNYWRGKIFWQYHMSNLLEML